MTDTQTSPDALDLTREADRLYLEVDRAREKLGWTCTQADIDAYLRAFEQYTIARERADRAAGTFGLGTEGVAG